MVEPEGKMVEECLRAGKLCNPTPVICTIKKSY